MRCDHISRTRWFLPISPPMEIKKSATLCQLNGFAKGSSSFLLLDCYDSQASEKKAEIYSNRKSLSMCRNVFLVFYISPKWKQHSNVPCMCKNTLLILLFLLSFITATNIHDEKEKKYCFLSSDTSVESILEFPRNRDCSC